MEKLSKKHWLFVEAFDGDLVYAMRVAGYSGVDAYLKQEGNKLLKEPLIYQAIQDRGVYVDKTKKLIATREERQALWTKIMMNEDPHRKPETDANNVPIPEGNIPLPIRLKASELLGKSEADFVDKIDMSVQHSISDLIQQSYTNTRPIEDIEADYYKLKENPQLSTPTIEDLI